MRSSKRRFGDFLRSSEGIPTNILAERLRRLEECGLVRRAVYQQRPARYEYRLTAMGADLLPLLRELIAWANRNLPGTARPPAALLERASQAAAEAPPGDPAPNARRGERGDRPPRRRRRSGVPT